MDETSRLSAAEIHARVERGAEEELERPVRNLAISAVAAGLAMGLSGLGWLSSCTRWAGRPRATPWRTWRTRSGSSSSSSGGSSCSREAASPGWATVFWSAVVGGWIIALVAWLVTACTDTTSQVLIVVLLTYVVGIGHFAHSIAGSGEVLTALLSRELGAADNLVWVSAAVSGNIVGGVVMVALFNYGQVRKD